MGSSSIALPPGAGLDTPPRQQRLAIFRQRGRSGSPEMAENGKTLQRPTPYAVGSSVGRAGGEMHSGHDGALADRGMPIELVLTGRRYPRFVLLLIAMLSELTLAPFIELLPRGPDLVQLVTASVLIAALGVAGSRRIAVTLFSAALLVHLTAAVTPDAAIVAAAHALRLVFLCYVVGLVLYRVLMERAVTLDTVAGAACAYLLLGLVWGDLFLLLESWRPGSFSVPPEWMKGSAGTLRATLNYFTSPR